jgi:CBS domain-containing protein
MTKAIPTVQKYMTTAPHSIGTDQPLARAHEMMRSLDIRHLPVLSGGQLVGMLTDRDLALIESMGGVELIVASRTEEGAGPARAAHLPIRLEDAVPLSIVA